MQCQIHLYDCSWSIGVNLFGIYPPLNVQQLVLESDSTWWLAWTIMMEVVDPWSRDPLYQKSSWRWVQTVCLMGGAMVQVSRACVF